MRLYSNNFKHLDTLTKEMVIDSPHLRWDNYPFQTGGFLIIFVNQNNQNIYWALLVPGDVNEINETNKYKYQLSNSFNTVEYNTPNDENEIVVYSYTIYALKNPQLQKLESMIAVDNVLDKASLKFIFNGFK